MFSVGLLYSSHDFLKLSLEAIITPDEFKKYFKTFKYSTAERILEVTFKCGWAKVTQIGNIQLTERGKEISSQDYKSALSNQLEDLIMNFNPSWASVLPKGRFEAKFFLPTDVMQCFKEAGMFDELNQEIIGKWDNLALAYRNFSQKRMLEIGRIGEKLSFDFEFQRTGKRPIWQAIESNLSGFDLLSVTEPGLNQKLQIEVKTSTSNIEYAKIHLSKNEWQTAQNSLNFVFHLWIIGSNTKPFIINVQKMAENVPYNNGDGEWEAVEIPFKALL